MTNSDTHLSDSEFRKEELKTVKSRRRLYTSTFIIVMFVLLYLLGRALNILATPVAIVVWTIIIVFCLRSPVNYLESKGIGRLSAGCSFRQCSALVNSSLRCFKPSLTRFLRCATSGMTSIRSTPTSFKTSVFPIG